MAKPKPFPKKAAPVFAELQCRPPGVYREWPEHEYHFDEAYSASKGRKLVVGPVRFWKGSSFNPDYSSDGGTPALIKGRAYHKRLLEGVAAFEAAFARPPSKADYPDALDGGKELGAECEANGLKKSGTIAEQVQRLKDAKVRDRAGNPLEFWADIMAKWEAANGHKQKLPPGLEAEIELAAKICEAHPDIGPRLKGGHPEISIAYISRAGVPCRTRLDYWRPGEITELKTMANTTGQPFPVATARTIVAEFYHVQAVIEREAAEAALQMPDDMWHGFDAEEIAAYRAAGVPDVRFLFLGTPDPDICLRIFAPEVPIDFAYWPETGQVVEDVPRTESTLWRSAENIHEQLQAKFRFYWAKFGRAPWFDLTPAIGLKDSDPGISSWSLTREVELEG